DLVPIAGLGDWYDYGHGKPVGPSRFTPLHLTAMATFAECTRVVSSAAQVLGHTNDSKKYDELHARIRARFNEKFYKGGGEYQNSGSPQTANAMALVFNLVPDADREKTADAIVEDMRE